MALVEPGEDWQVEEVVVEEVAGEREAEGAGLSVAVESGVAAVTGGSRLSSAFLEIDSDQKRPFGDRNLIHGNTQDTHHNLPVSGCACCGGTVSFLPSAGIHDQAIGTGSSS